MRHTTIFALILLISLLFINCAEMEESEVLAPITEKYVEVWNTGNFDGIERILDPNFERRATPDFEPTIGIEEFEKVVISVRAQYPDFHLVVDESFFEEGKGAARWTITATNTGPGDFPPTGKKATVTGLNILHFKDGKIQAEWVATNNLSWMNQLGFQVMPPVEEEQ